MALTYPDADVIGLDYATVISGQGPFRLGSRFNEVC